METNPLLFLIAAITVTVDEISAVLQPSSFDSKVLFVDSGLHYYKGRCFHGFCLLTAAVGASGEQKYQQYWAPVSLFRSRFPSTLPPCRWNTGACGPVCQSRDEACLCECRNIETTHASGSTQKNSTITRRNPKEMHPNPPLL